MASTAPETGGWVALLSGPKAALTAKLLVSAALVGVLVSMAGKRELWEALRNASPLLLAAAAAASLLEEVFRAWKQKRILDRMGSALGLFALMGLNLRTFAISLLLPGELLGGGARVLLMRKYMSVEQSLFLVLYDRYTQLAVTLALGTALSLALTESPALILTFALTTAALAVLPALFLHAGLASRLEHLLPRNWGRKAGEAFARLRARFTWDLENIRIALISTAYQAARALVVWCLCFAAGIRIGFPAVMLFLSLIILVQHLPVSFGGVGLREVTAVGFFGMYGVEMEKALAMSLLVYVLTLAKAALGGLAGLPGRDELRGRPAG